jgi:hypothetical protein
MHMATRLATLTRDSQLDALTAELVSLRARVEQLEERRVMRDDRAVLTMIAEKVEGRVFSSEELLGHCRVHRDLALALRGLRTVNRLGTYLRSRVGRDYGPFRLVRVRRDNRGTLWAVHMRDLHEASRNSTETGA